MNFSRRRAANPSSLLPDLPLGAEILVIRLRSIGDVVLTLPAIEALHEWRPDFRISFLVQPFCAALVEGHPAIAHVLLLTDFWPTVRMLRRRRFAAVFNMHAGPTSALLTGFSGAPLRVCWARRQYSFVYNVEVPSNFPVEGRVPRHAAEHRAQQFLWAGMPAGNIPPARVYPQADAIAAGRTHSGGQRFASRRTIRGAASRRGRRFQALARGELCRDRALAAREVRADSGGESRSRRRGDRRRGQRAPRAAERDRRFAGLAATDGAARRREFVCRERHRTDAHRGRAAKEMRGDFWNERLCRLVPVEDRTPRGGEQIPLRALSARTLCKLAGVAVHSHDFAWSKCAKPATRCSARAEVQTPPRLAENRKKQIPRAK